MFIMKKLITVTLCLAFGVASLSAQSFFDKIDNIASKVDNASRKVDRAANTAERANKTGGKLASMFGKKNKPDETKTTEVAETMQTTINVSNASLATLKERNNIVNGLKGVESTQMKFNTNRSIIKVSHTGSTDDFLDKIQEKSKSIFTDKNVTDLDNGSISLKL